ncbi:MAG TPA: cyclase family protein [Clostridia bacterium]
MKKLIDISYTISERLPVWPGDVKFEMHDTMSIEKGDICNNAYIKMCLHMGTHVDFPRHFIKDGSAAHDTCLENFTGRAVVYEFGDKTCIGVDDMKDIPFYKGDVFIIKSLRNEALLKKGEFTFNFTGIDEDAAKYIVNKGVKAVGINYYSIEGPGKFPVHKTLLENGVMIIEGLSLAEVAPGMYTIFFFPLKIENGNGAPVRAVLMEE